MKNFRFNINRTINNNINEIISTDNNIDTYSLLNKKIVHKGKKICLTEQNKKILY